MKESIETIMIKKTSTKKGGNKRENDNKEKKINPI